MGARSGAAKCGRSRRNAAQSSVSLIKSGRSISALRRVWRAIFISAMRRSAIAGRAVQDSMRFMVSVSGLPGLSGRSG